MSTVPHISSAAILDAAAQATAIEDVFRDLGRVVATLDRLALAPWAAAAAHELLRERLFSAARRLEGFVGEGPACWRLCGLLVDLLRRAPKSLAVFECAIAAAQAERRAR